MLDPHAAALLRLIEAKGLPPVHQETPEAARESYRSRRFYAQPPAPSLPLTRDLRIDGPAGALPVRVYRPVAHDQPIAALVYFHGGGWVIGDLDTHDTLCRELAAQGGFAVISVDYRLAPEHRFPAAVDDGLTALRWARSNAAALAIDPDRLAVGGDSAGGHLAAVSALALREADENWLRFQLLIYPATDMRQDTESYHRNGQGYLLDKASMNWFRAHFMGTSEAFNDWRASPLLHPDLRQLPPALVLTAGFDPLLDDGRHYADAMSAAGNTVQYVCFQRQIHGFITMGRVIEEANTAVLMCAAATARALAPG